MALTWDDAPLVICSIVLPPLGVFFQVGLNKDFAINLLLTLLGYLPGLIHALWLLSEKRSAFKSIA